MRSIDESTETIVSLASICKKDHKQRPKEQKVDEIGACEAAVAAAMMLV